jgi:hypothetical protein
MSAFARHAEQALGDGVRVEHAAVARIGAEDAGRRVVDRAAVARFLLAEELLAAFDEEVGDVEDADLQLLDEEGDEACAVQRIRGVGALELGRERAARAASAPRGSATPGTAR